MPDRRRGVLSLTMGLAIALLFSTGSSYLATGGAQGASERSAFYGLFAPNIPLGPKFGAPAPVLPADAPGGAAATEAGITQVLAPLLADPRLNGKVAVSVRDAESGESLYQLKATDMVTPASTTKIVTAAAALGALGPYHRFTTKVVTGSGAGEIVLVGGGDPTLAIGPKGTYQGAARLDVLAKQVKAAAGGEPITRIVVDTTLFTGPDRGTGWDPTIVNEGYVAPVSALTVNGGRVAPTAAVNARPAARTTAPDLFAGRAFARLLGVPTSAVSRGVAPDGARELGRIASPPLQHLVEQMLQLSDNVIAESLARQVAVAKDQPATFDGSAQAVKAIIGDLGLDPAADALLDGSGLSRQNRLTPELLTGILHAAAASEHPQLRGIFAGLPVAGYSGTLANRFTGPANSAAGEVRAKTGSLAGVSALSGVVVTEDGRQLVFAMVANGFPPNAGEAVAAALDRTAAALARCGCA